MTTHYPSLHEASLKIQPELDLIDSLTVRAEYADSSAPEIRYREIVGEKGMPNSAAPFPKVTGSAKSSGQIFEDHYEFMDEARNHPSDGLKAHYTRLGWGIEKGNRILRELKALRYVVVSEVRAANQKSGRSRLVVTVTAKGEEMLNGFDKLKS